MGLQYGADRALQSYGGGEVGTYILVPPHLGSWHSSAGYLLQRASMRLGRGRY